MAALTETKVYHGSLAGQQRLHVVTGTLTSASDTITFTAADGFDTIDAIVNLTLTGGVDAAFTWGQASFSGLVVTIATLEEDGTASTEWTGTTFTLVLLVSGNAS